MAQGYYSCSRCGKIHPKGYICKVEKKHYKYSYKESRLRSKSAWTNKSKQIREDANYLCEVCKDKGVYNYRNVEVHHIEKLKEQPELWLDDDNLICLCKDCHRMADAGMIDKEYLKKLARQRINRLK